MRRGGGDRCGIGDDAARMPYIGSWVLAQEMLKRKELRKETEAFLVRVCASPEVRSSTEFSYSPAKMLLKIYKESNRKVESRALLATWLKPESQNQYDADYQNYRELQNQMLISKEFSALGYPLEGPWWRGAAWPIRPSLLRSRGGTGMTTTSRGS